MLRTMWLRSLCVAAPLACCGAHAQAPPRAFDDGPLLCFTTNTLPAKPAEVLLHVVPLHGDAKPTVFWTNRGNANVLARLDRDRLLLASYGEPYALIVVDLAAGTHRVLADGCPHEFVAVHGDHVLHLGDPREAARDNFLYATPWAAPGERRRLAERRLERVPQVAGNLAVAIAAGEASVWIVSITSAKGRAVWTAPAGVSSLRTALSPTGQRLAIGCVQSDGRGLLTVVDLGAATVLRSWPDLPIQVSPLSSSTPCLEVGWYDDAEVVCSETRGDGQGLAGSFVFVRRGVATGEVTDEREYAGIGLSHDVPPRAGPSAPAPRAVFTVAHDAKGTRLLCDGATDPLATFAGANLQTGDVCVAPDGRSAVARVGANSTQYTLFTDVRKDGRLLTDAFAYDAVWLPAASAVRASGR